MGTGFPADQGSLREIKAAQKSGTIRRCGKCAELHKTNLGTAPFTGEETDEGDGEAAETRVVLFIRKPGTGQRWRTR